MSDETAGLIEWWGQRNDMPFLMARAHIVALPSYREGLPTVLLEAAACMRPIVATDVAGCREIVRDGENGILVSVRNAQALAEAIIRLIENPDLRRRMGERGRQMVTEQFTIGQVTSPFLVLYAKLLSDAGSVN